MILPHPRPTHRSSKAAARHHGNSQPAEAALGPEPSLPAQVSVYLKECPASASLGDSPSGQRQRTPQCSLTSSWPFAEGHLEGQGAVSSSYPAGLEGESDSFPCEFGGSEVGWDPSGLPEASLPFSGPSHFVETGRPPPPPAPRPSLAPGVSLCGPSASPGLRRPWRLCHL